MKGRFQDLTGRKFGMLTAIERVKMPDGKSKWKCRCDCGNITYVTAGHLNAGTSTSCGCKNKSDLTGKRFGKLTVLKDSGKRKKGNVLWECRCDCGNDCLKPTNELNSGFARSCGCVWRKSAVHAGDRFGRLTAIEPTDKRECRAVVWRCKCDCGNEAEVRSTELTNGHTTSCGCYFTELHEQQGLKDRLTYTDDTCIEFLEKISEPRSTTSQDTGVRGVCMLKNGKYRATLKFRKKYYFLGDFKELNSAIKARKRGEAMVQEYLDDYYARKERGD